MRNVWKYYFSSTEGIIFVVDSHRRDRLTDVKEELWKVLQDDSAIKIPILIYANKQDLGDSMTADFLIQELDLKDNSTCNPNSLIHIQECSCKGDNPGAGLQEGFQWLTNQIIRLNLAKVKSTTDIQNNV